MKEKADLQRRSDGEQCRNKDLSGNFYDLENRCRNADENLAASRREQDELRFQNQSLNGHNDDMRSEIDALQHHCSVLTNQNKDLNGELERFVETDEQIRNTLNRRDRVETLRHKTDNELRTSYANLERASPRRRH